MTLNGGVTRRNLNLLLYELRAQHKIASIAVVVESEVLQ